MLQALRAVAAVLCRCPRAQHAIYSRRGSAIPRSVEQASRRAGVRAVLALGGVVRVVPRVVPGCGTPPPRPGGKPWYLGQCGDPSSKRRAALDASGRHQPERRPRRCVRAALARLCRGHQELVNNVPLRDCGREDNHSKVKWQGGQHSLFTTMVFSMACPQRKSRQLSVAPAGGPAIVAVPGEAAATAGCCPCAGLRSRF